MNIKTKYEIGDRVWVVYEPIINNQHFHNEPTGEVAMYDDVISSIEIHKDEIFYLLEKADCVDLKEDEVILYHETDKLLAKIQKLMHEIHEREKEGSKDE